MRSPANAVAIAILVLVVAGIVWWQMEWDKAGREVCADQPHTRYDAALSRCVPLQP